MLLLQCYVMLYFEGHCGKLNRIKLSFFFALLFLFLKRLSAILYLYIYQDIHPSTHLTNFLSVDLSTSLLIFLCLFINMYQFDYPWLNRISLVYPFAFLFLSKYQHICKTSSLCTVPAPFHSLLPSVPHTSHISSLISLSLRTRAKEGRKQ